MKHGCGVIRIRQNGDNLEVLPTDFYQGVEKYIPTLMLVALET
jgi:hypothetical protein